MREAHVIPVVRPPHEYQVYRIDSDTTNRIAIVFDPATVNSSITYCIEIFDVDGKTPPHRPEFAVETFFVLKGEGIAICDGREIAIRSGDALLVPPTAVHEIHNTGAERLYTLTGMVPNEDFVELIRSGVPVELDAEDLAVLRRNTMVVHPAHAALPEASAVEALGQTWGQTLASRNPQQISALYAPEAVLLATFTNELDTAPEILEYFTGLTMREGLNVRFDEQNIRILDTNTASNSGLYTFSFVQDGKIVEVPARYTFLYEKQDDQWLILEHHSSLRPETAN